MAILSSNLGWTLRGSPSTRWLTECHSSDLFSLTANAGHRSSKVNVSKEITGTRFPGSKGAEVGPGPRGKEYRDAISFDAAHATTWSNVCPKFGWTNLSR
jgi:hypothetical protein